MSVKIRLQRTGKRDGATYRIVAVDESAKRDGKILSLIGSYNPNLKPPLTKIDRKKMSEWISKGAVTSESVKNLMKNS